jgi:hypothetical protein
LASENKMKRLYDFLRLWKLWGNPKEAWEDSKTINDKEFQSEMGNLDIRLEEFLDSIPDEKWNKVKLNLEAKKTHRVVQETIKKRKHAIDFAEWILSHKISSITEDSTWNVNKDENISSHTTEELYGIYLRGDLDDYYDEEE